MVVGRGSSSWSVGHFTEDNQFEFPNWCCRVALWSGFDAQERPVTDRLSDDGCWAGFFKLVGGALRGG